MARAPGSVVALGLVVVGVVVVAGVFYGTSEREGTRPSAPLALQRESAPSTARSAGTSAISRSG
jgi:hypothetical protein